MDVQQLEKDFAAIGARVRVQRRSPRRVFPWQRVNPTFFSVDVGTDKRGEFFDIWLGPEFDSELVVVDKKPDIRHLVLMNRENKAKILCGHDERHWFAAGVATASRGVEDAMLSLKPVAIRGMERRKGLKLRDRLKRKNDVYVRQGEWFFVPVEHGVDFTNQVIHRNEPIRLVGRTEHIVEELCRRGGRTVMISASYNGGKPISVGAYSKLLRENKEARDWMWQTRSVGANVYARGAVRHPDHKTVVLKGWHEVHALREMISPSEYVTFID